MLMMRDCVARIEEEVAEKLSQVEDMQDIEVDDYKHIITVSTFFYEKLLSVPFTAEELKDLKVVERKLMVSHLTISS